MSCPFCQSDTSVAISRPASKQASVWRRRQCSRCRKVFSTREKPDLARLVAVSKADGTHEPFADDVLFLSVHASLAHRKDAPEASRKLCETIMARVLPKTQGNTLNRRDIAKTTYKILKRFDKPGAVHYKSHHKDLLTSA